ncbi:tetratricopeptide repeat protein [Methylovorus mays]|uniref:tetratricopeptide repeat protein n=1 Tax=Methylovorus mays TaxID=184077 RepID=UPI001E398245|nr:tetratricopeptide repeat protein [Methylovorus mays]MCB5206054.1 tetratricopeptide repeat protein [Methylovorus mays]
MAYDLEEQEQLDALKSWWKTNGKYVQVLLIAVVIGLAGYKGWNYYLNQQAIKASAKYQAMTQLDIKDTQAIQAAAGELMDKFSSTPYAARAAIAAAKVSYTSKDLASAKRQLAWAAEHAKEDQVAAVAMLQLAGIQFEEKDHEAALKTLAQKHDAAFDGLFADLKGDILLAQGKKAEAKQAYQEALLKLDEQGRYRRFTEHKLESLGS